MPGGVPGVVLSAELQDWYRHGLCSMLGTSSRGEEVPARFPDVRPLITAYEVK